MRRADMTNKKVIYTCPIRGRIESTSLEEYYRIECLNYLIKKEKIPKEKIELEKILEIYGFAKKNNLRADIVVYDGVRRELSNIIYIAEIKVRATEKAKAIQDQLLPAMRNCDNIIYGIYWDEIHRVLVDRKGKEQTGTFQLHYEEENNNSLSKLEKIKDTQALWVAIENGVRNYNGGTKSKHREILKLLITKYYDEKVNNENLVFTTSNTTIVNTVRKLYTQAIDYYGKEILEVIFNDTINLTDDCIENCVKILQNYSLSVSDSKIIQEFYMKFAPSFLKKDLSQYYTPKEIANFMVAIVPITRTTKALDPCSGSGDFMVGVLKTATEKGVDGDIAMRIFCWDIDEDASALAQINMILNGDGRSNVKTINSLKDIHDEEDEYNLIITNPPFGVKTVYTEAKGYELQNKTKESGKLFIERCTYLLKEKGLLVIILPNGYLENPTDIYVREYILSHYTIKGIIGLPNNVFKCTGSGGRTSILILEKNTSQKKENYYFFVHKANKVGFDHTRKQIPLLLHRNEETGAFSYDNENNPVIDNDLVSIEKQYREFLEQDKNSTKNSMPVSAIHTDDTKRFFYTLYLQEYKECVKRIKASNSITLKEMDATITNNSNKTLTDTDEYTYIETGNVYRDTILETQILRGWALPNRAKVILEKDTILVSKMEGTFNNFYYNIEQSYIASNGFYSIYIPDEEYRLQFLRFLFTKEYILQMESLCTGTIMADVKQEDIYTNLHISLYEDTATIKKYIDNKKSREEYVKHL